MSSLVARFYHWFLGFCRKPWTLPLAVLFLIILLAVLVVLLKTERARPVSQSVESSVVLVQVPSSLNGAMVTPETAARRPFAIMIDNSVAARPALGLSRAAVVFELPVEGGLTRLLAVWQTSEAIAVGPVRSAREYVIPLVQGLRAAYVHSGGSPAALELLRRGDVLDADEFRNGTFFSRRVGSMAPHNLFTSTDNLDALAVARGWATWQPVPPIVAGDAMPEGRVPALRATISPSSLPTYRTEWQWDEAVGGYGRFIGGVRSVDRESHEPVVAHTVVILKTDVTAAPRPGALDAVTVRVTGAGDGYLLRDGYHYPITWRKDGVSGQLVFHTLAAAPIPVAPGLLWIHFIPTLGGRVSFVP